MTTGDQTSTDQTVVRRTHAGDAASSSTSPRARGPGLRNQMIEYPLASLFGAVIVVLLGFVTHHIQHQDQRNQRPPLQPGDQDRSPDRPSRRPDGGLGGSDRGLGGCDV